jgi:hypothetical protein
MNVLETALFLYAYATIYTIINYFTLFNNNQYIQFYKISFSNIALTLKITLFSTLLTDILYFTFIRGILELLGINNLIFFACCCSLIDVCGLKYTNVTIFINDLSMIKYIGYFINKLLLHIVIYYYLAQTNIIYASIIHITLSILILVINRYIFKLLDPFLRPVSTQQEELTERERAINEIKQWFKLRVCVEQQEEKTQEEQEELKVQEIAINEIRQRINKTRENIFANK